MGQVKVETEAERVQDYQRTAKAAVYRLETCQEELTLAINALRRCMADPSRKILVASDAYVDVVAAISRSIESEIDACLARTAE